MTKPLVELVYTNPPRAAEIDKRISEILDRLNEFRPYTLQMNSTTSYIIPALRIKHPALDSKYSSVEEECKALSDEYKLLKDEQTSLIDEAKTWSKEAARRYDALPASYRLYIATM